MTFLGSAHSLTEDLGSPADDASGAMSKRILLLLESRPLVNHDVYDRLVDDCVEAYWKNEKGHEAQARGRHGEAGAIRASGVPGPDFGVGGSRVGDAQVPVP